MGIQIAEGLGWLHGKTFAIAHLDLKPDNVLVDKKGVCKVHDFGMSKLRKGSTTLIANKGGNALYASPEFLDPYCGLGDADIKSDVYSFSLLFWNILTGDIPNGHIQTFEELLEEVVMNGYRPPQTGKDE
eukprot:TRINITY_DN250_c0_g1_i25.p3 TRINITY_DN250_c0_g1~~TRINITY_DN250_c0_g1_i25.p3  ORF type:complete len:130 (-),score=27.98 TRINITY_DN250_c0_g1_i25:888-1277(-)